MKASNILVGGLEVGHSGFAADAVASPPGRAGGVVPSEGRCRMSCNPARILPWGSPPCAVAHGPVLHSD
jgi:hypothetical protein